jgi:hypothetical protein
MNFDTPPKINRETTVIPPTPIEQAPSDEPANLESEARALTTEMLVTAQNNREANVEKAGFTMKDLETNYPGVFKFLRITGLAASLLIASNAAYAGGPVVRGPVINGPVIHAAAPIKDPVIHAPVVRAAVVHAPVVRAPGEKTMKTVITTNQATPSSFKETSSTQSSDSHAKGDVRTDSRGNVSGNVRGGIDLTRG